MFGIDISGYQGNNINFIAAKNSGVEVCIIKATEDTYFTNQYFAYQVNGALNSGMKIGFYHFFRGAGIAEADYFINVINPYIAKMQVKPVIDVEAYYNDLNNQVLAFIGRVKERTGLDCIIYSGAYFAGDNLTDKKLLNYGLWVAHYGVQTPSLRGIWTSYVGHQYSEYGSVPGFDSDMDLNNFYDGIFIGKKEIDYKGDDVMFSENWYLAKNPDVADAVKKGYFKNAYDHYIHNGKAEGRQPLPPIPAAYNEGDYLALNPDVKAAVDKKIYTSGVDHFMQYGFNENRKISKNESEEAIKKRIADLEVKIEKIKEIIE